MSVTENEIFSDDNQSLTYWKRKAEDSEKRLLLSQIRNHESVRLVKWTAFDDLIETLGLYAYDVECVAIGALDAFRAALQEYAEAKRTIAARDARISQLIAELRATRPEQRRRAA